MVILGLQFAAFSRGRSGATVPPARGVESPLAAHPELFGAERLHPQRDPATGAGPDRTALSPAMPTDGALIICAIRSSAYGISGCYLTKTTWPSADARRTWGTRSAENCRASWPDLGRGCAPSRAVCIGRSDHPLPLRVDRRSRCEPGGAPGALW